LAIISRNNQKQKEMMYANIIVWESATKFFTRELLFTCPKVGEHSFITAVFRVKKVKGVVPFEKLDDIQRSIIENNKIQYLYENNGCNI
jgi:hypothetical protein